MQEARYEQRFPNGWSLSITTTPAERGATAWVEWVNPDNVTVSGVVRLNITQDGGLSLEINRYSTDPRLVKSLAELRLDLAKA